MKTIYLKLLVLLAFTSMITSVKAQSKFIQPGAEWRYVFNDTWYPQGLNSIIRYVGDAVFAGDTMHILQASNTNKNDQSCYGPGDTYIKQKGDTVFFKNPLTNSNWQILYNFATPVGQYWTTVFTPSTAANNTYLVFVDAVSTVTINGIPLKQLKVRYVGGPNGVESTYITERIGCHQFMFNYYRTPCATDQSWFNDFICYKDSTLGTKQMGLRPCTYFASISENKQLPQNQLSISPNPANSSLAISFQHAVEANSSFEIYDMLGKKVIEHALQGNSCTLQTSNFANGCYIIRVTGPHQQTYVSRFVIAH